jgi:hypothetical protein
MKRAGTELLAALAALAVSVAGQAPPATEIRTTFEVRYVAPGAVYISGGRDEGLAEGFHLQVKRVKPGEPTLSAEPFAQLVVTAVAAHSSACSIESSKEDLQVGDVAVISRQDLEALEAIQQSKTARRYAQVVTFTDGDPLEQEGHDYVPKPPSPEVNKVRGRVSYEFDLITDHDTGLRMMQHGMVVKLDANRIAGTYWSFNGYWRGRVNLSSGAEAQTITLMDLMNRTYTAGFTYNNPQKSYVMGIGRLYLPWATSLGTLDGAHFAWRLPHKLTVGTFAGSTPDPTVWDYKPNRQIGGAFVNLETGSYETLRFSTTVGLALTRLSWKAEREFAFTENMLSINQHFSIYHNLEADRLTPGRLGNTESGAVLSRSFLTARYQPWRWLTVDLNHNYFRTIPTFDLILVGTGLLDKFLFTGLSSGVRIELPYRITAYGNLGQSNRSGDARRTLNKMYGLGFRNVLGTGVQADLRHSDFSGAYGTGWYQSVSFSRELTERLRLQVMGGQQVFRSPLLTGARGFFMNSSFDWFLSRHYFLNAGVNLFRGGSLNYDQTFISLGYRF